jgi:hypothetical protein
MSYVLTGYIVDIPRLEAVIGSQDTSVVEAVMENNPEEFDIDEDEFDDEEEGELTIATALRHLIMGEEKDPEEAHQYGYAFAEICDCFGELQLCQMWNGVRWSAVEQCGLEDLLTKTGPPVQLPPNSDGPAIGHIRRGEVGQYLQAARDRLTKTQDSEIHDLLVEYIDWLEAAQRKGLDIVFFYH